MTSGESYKYQVAAAVDGGEASRSALLSVEVVNEPPAITGQTRFYVEENQTAAGTVTAKDRDDSITGYTRGGPDASLFSITLSEEDGVLTFNTAPDFEAPGSAAGTNQYTITVTATSGTGDRQMPSAPQGVIITVTDVDEPSTITGHTTGAVTEDAEDNIASGTLTINDPDTDDSPTITTHNAAGTFGTFSITTGGAWAYTLDNAKSATNALDAGDTPEDRFTVTASDSTTQVVTITISGADDAPIITSDPRFDAPENQTEAGTVTAEDVDADDSITGYALGDADAASFSITLSEEDGVLTFNTAPDFETKSVYTITVTATGGAGSRTLDSTPQTVVIAVTDVNEAPAITNALTEKGGVDVIAFTVEENQTEAGTVTAEDVDADDSITGYALGGADAASFSITLSEEDGVLTFNDAPNLEVPGSAARTNEYTVELTATGGAGGRTLDSASQTVVISVTGVNEAPASPALTDQQAREGEGFTYLFPESTDPEGHPVSYTAGLRDGGDLPAWLTFDSDSRSFTITASEPLSVSGDYDVTVTASDGQTPPLSSEAHFHLTVIAVDAPSFTTPATFSVAENATAVGTVTASDPNPGDTVTSIEITDGADRDRFSFSDGAIRVETASAELMFRSPPDHENPEDTASTGPPNPSGNNEYVVVLTATSGADAKTSTQAITVTVTDVEEPPAKPAAPTVTPGGEPVSLRVTWSAPDTSDKDPIDGYDVRYREEGAGSWKTHPHNDPGTTTTIRGLTAGITCEVQVQATNAEGASDWSDSGTGTAAADTPPRITNPGSDGGGSVGGGGGSRSGGGGSGGVTPAVSVGFKGDGRRGIRRKLSDAYGPVEQDLRARYNHTRNGGTRHGRRGRLRSIHSGGLDHQPERKERRGVGVDSRRRLGRGRRAVHAAAIPGQRAGQCDVASRREDGDGHHPGPRPALAVVLRRRRGGGQGPNAGSGGKDRVADSQRRHGTAGPSAPGRTDLRRGGPRHHGHAGGGR